MVAAARLARASAIMPVVIKVILRLSECGGRLSISPLRWRAVISSIKTAKKMNRYEKEITKVKNGVREREMTVISVSVILLMKWKKRFFSMRM